jgi:hypothetical protein
MIQVDDATNHVMRSHVRDDGYVTLAWPKNATLRDLEWIRAACILQLDTFIHSARRETEREEAARLEYESWNCSAAHGVMANGLTETETSATASVMGIVTPPGVPASHKSAPIQKRERPLPELPEAKVMVRDTDDEPEGGGWIVDCDCEGPLSHSLEVGEALYTAEQMREYARTALGVPEAQPQQQKGGA